MALWNKLQTELDRFGRAAQSAFDEGKARLEIMRVRQLADKSAQALGYAVYNARKEGGDLDAETYARLSSTLAAHEAEAQRLEAQMDAARAARGDAMDEGGSTSGDEGTGSGGATGGTGEGSTATGAGGSASASTSGVDPAMGDMGGTGPSTPGASGGTGGTGGTGGMGGSSGSSGSTGSSGSGSGTPPFSGPYSGPQGGSGGGSPSSW